MDTCPYYFERVHTNGAEREVVPCCRHKHAPVPCDAPTELSRSVVPNELKCGGHVGRCQIPPYLQLDI